MFKGLEDYVSRKIYNSEFGDILPKILCDCLSTDFIIACRLNSADYTFICLEKDNRVTPHSLAARIQMPHISLLKSGDHYDALVPKATIPPSVHGRLSNTSSKPCTVVSAVIKDGESASPVCSPTKSKPIRPSNTNCIPNSSVSKLKIVGLNVNGFLNKYEKGILDMYISHFDVICLSETHLRELPSNFTKSSLGDYDFLSKVKGDNCQNDSPYGGFHGLGMFTHPRLQATP